ncbi:dynein heavy chain 1, axonemal-like isoform X2 [Sitophilus oryzae]|uniref:Dynein heavy chain 1, axonemal-like isoform X2 n=1 Tax=Sitophilus oryzae TaxID=7048 RepID=A0A6J2YUN1_SITOR|nr:dynein heavy chain 1, axonemal-like isoform X2 [Sitophilus oryzae]
MDKSRTSKSNIILKEVTPPKKKKYGRGYYAELLTNLNTAELQKRNFPGSHKKTSLIWQARTERHAPIFMELVAPGQRVALAPAERWMTFEADKDVAFPVNTFKPKVQHQHEVDPKTLPRNVAIERRRRQYQWETLPQVLERMNIKNRDLLPIDVLYENFPSASDRYGLYSWIPFLPLELFDNEEYMVRTAENWIEHGVIDGIRHPLPGTAFVPNENLTDKNREAFSLDELYHWVDVAISDYNYETKCWHVTTLDGFKRTFELPKVYLTFKAEDPVHFGDRIIAAINLRKKTEEIIRCEFFIDCMPLTGTPTMSDEMLNRIIEKVRKTRVGKNMYYFDYFQTLKQELLLSHQRTIGELDFRGSQSVNDYNFFDIEKCTMALNYKVIDTGQSKADFINKKNYFAWYTIYMVPETHLAMSYVAGECIKMGQMSLFSTTFGAKYITLEEFSTVQNQTSSIALKQLKTTWLETLVFNIRMCIGDLGKGWFDINERIYEVYEISKLNRFMELVKYRMQYTLRLLVENSIELFINLVESPCIPCLGCEEDFVWGSDLITSPFISHAMPIFNLQLKMDENGAYYTTSPEYFAVVLLKLFDEALIQTHQVRQVHPLLLSNLSFPPDLYLSSVGLLADEVCQVRDRFLLAYEKAIIPLKAYAKEFEAHVNLYVLDIPEFISNYESEQKTAADFKEDISQQYRLKRSLEETLPNVIFIGPFYVTVDFLRLFLINKRQDIINKLLDLFALKMKICIEDLLQDFKNIMTKLSVKPENIEHIFEIRDWMETVPLTVKSLEENCKRYLLEYEVLDHFWYALQNEDFDNKWEAIGWPLKVTQQIEATEVFLKEEEDRYYKLQMNDEFTLNDRIETLTSQVVNMSGYKDISRTHEYALEIRKVWKTMKEAQEFGQLLNQRQKLFGAPVVPFDNLTKLIKEFEPYKNLWTTASDWMRAYEMWMDNPIINVDADTVDVTVNDMYKMMVRLTRVFADMETVQGVAIAIRNQIDEFKPLIPLLQCIRNPGMRQRHWDEFAEKTDIQLVWSTTITFHDVLALGVEQYIDEIKSIAEAATKEYSIEQTLDKMLAQWEDNRLELTAYKDTGTYIMKISEEQQQMLDDHIVMTQQISFSPFKGPFEDKITEWEEKLKITAEVIEEWMDVQKQWMYMEPIFSSEDITKQLPAESKKYKTMERTWKRIMRNALDIPNIIEYCGDRRLLESLKDANHVLQVIQKGLSEYLEIKRVTFPRLYFLSDDELLEILSQARNPLAVQPHLRKCFENISRLTFEEDLKITEMFSAEEECVALNPTLYPTGNVEHWMLVVEDSMRNTIRTILGESLKEIYEKERKEWVLCWPGQVVIACSQAFWTAGVEKGIADNALDTFLEDVVIINLDALRGLVKGNLTFLQREILSALIVIEVHSRDVTQNLVNLNIVNVNDFDWISQLRYYWIQDQMKVRAVNAEFPYGYEYLGNSGRLVITPLTDRCYLTLTGALHLKFGGAPAGPAGTGKTETTKDLAKAFAVQCVVFNCSDQLDFMAMGKFFKGLASSGAWACFDEFNRIDIEVLSVVAQQITTIQKAQQSRLDRFIFEGCDIVLKESCAVFITMNPGYAGRTELPDNLKALFRPVSMMVPDYSLIAEISLFSFGFSNARQLANKITTTFKLSSEQLSSQDHYDFGMRAVKTVISVAGNLKRENPDMDERQICLRALRDVNVPKFLKDDLKLFNGIVSDLFPRMVEQAVDYGALELAIRDSCIANKLEDVNEFVRKVIQLYETTIVRHGLMLVGPTGSGKTKVGDFIIATCS